MTDKEQLERMLDRIVASPTGCWIWVGTNNGAGRGRTITRGKLGYAYRRLFELLIGPIPEGLVLDHLCRTPICVNPTHLEPVTNAENARRNATGFCKRGHVLESGQRQCPICSRSWSRLHFGFTARYVDGRGYRDKGSEKCGHGHDLTPDNVYQRPSGTLECRTCMRLTNQRANAKRRARHRLAA